MINRHIPVLLPGKSHGHELEQTSGDGETCDPNGVTKSQTQLGN